MNDFLQKITELRARAKAEWLSRKKPEPAPPPWTGALTDRVSFAVGSGRCGTHFIAKLLEHEPDVASVHERDPLLQAFHRYCKWYELPIDDAGFLAVMEQRVRADLGRRRLSFESSPTLALSITDLHERFGARFVLLVRNPRDVVRSYLAKGWYTEPFVHERLDLALGYQPGRKFQHFLGRIAPRGEAFREWNRLSRVGKLAWYWAAVNEAALAKMAALPAGHGLVLRLEDVDHAKYQEIAAFLGFAPRLDAEKFDQIRKDRPGKQKNLPKIAWTPAEQDELAQFVTPLAQRFDYKIS